MLRLFKIENGLIHEIKCPLEELGSHLIQADWIDAHEPDEDERALLQHMLCTELPEPDEVEEIETSARCFVDQAGIHVHSLFLAQSEGRHTTVSVACILQKNCLITIREGDLADFRLLRMRALVSAQGVELLRRHLVVGTHHLAEQSRRGKLEARRLETGTTLPLGEHLLKESLDIG